MPLSRPEATQLNDFGANVRRERNAKAFTQEQFAEMVDLNIRTVQKIEAGEINILSRRLSESKRRCAARGRAYSLFTDTLAGCHNEAPLRGFCRKGRCRHHRPSGTAPLALREEPDAGGDLGISKELAGERDHALDESGLDESAADFALASRAAAHGAIGEKERHAAVRGEVVEHVLDPGEVRVAPRRGAVAPARVALQLRVPLAGSSKEK